jgi:spermidine/putrescine transport system ATP-binding protein
VPDFLAFDNIHKSFGTMRAVDGVSLGIGKGEVFSLLGPSGCGKTTLLRMVAGFDQPDSGRVLLDGQDITALPPNERPVNTVFQNYALFPHLSVRDNIAFGPRTMGRRELLADVDRMLSLVKLVAHADKKPAQLSGGQKQRVAIARALINKPQVLLLDEPLAALDLKLRQHMLAELHAIHREVGSTFVFVTHDQTEAIGLSDRIAVMNQGHIEQVGTPREIYESPSTSFVASFIGDTNFVSGRVMECVASGEAWLCTMETSVLGRVMARSSLSLIPGTRARLSVRPEDWWLRSGAADDALNAVQGVVEDVLYLGGSTRVTVRVKEERLVVAMTNRRLDDSANLRRSSQVWLGFHPEDAVVLPEVS